MGGVRLLPTGPLFSMNSLALSKYNRCESGITQRPSSSQVRGFGFSMATAWIEVRKESIIKAAGRNCAIGLPKEQRVMKVAMVKTYRQNRERFLAGELKRYDGQWVAFGADGRRIVADGERLKVSERVDAAGEDCDEVVLERIEIETGDIQLGGAELL